MKNERFKIFEGSITGWVNNELSDFFKKLNAIGALVTVGGGFTLLNYNQFGLSELAQLGFSVVLVVSTGLIFGFTATVISIRGELREIKSLLKEQNSR